MKKLLHILIMCFLLTACDKLPANGDLDGMWQLIEVEHNGVIRNVKEGQVYMSIQLKLFMLGDRVNSMRYYGYFNHEGDSIFFWQFSYPSMNESDDDNNLPVEEEDKGELERWGFYSLKERFKVEKLTKDLLIMQSDSVKIRYIKF